MWHVASVQWKEFAFPRRDNMYKCSRILNSTSSDIYEVKKLEGAPYRRIAAGRKSGWTWVENFLNWIKKINLEMWNQPVDGDYLHTESAYTIAIYWGTYYEDVTSLFFMIYDKFFGFSFKTYYAPGKNRDYSKLKVEH